MAMPIQRPPAGLLELLGLRGTGLTPTALEDYLRGSLDLTVLYLAPLGRTLRGATGVANATGFFAGTGLTVPTSEIWVATALSASSSNMAAGESYRLSPAVSRGGSVNTLEIFRQGEQTASGITQRIGTGVALELYDLYGPGDAFGVYVTDVTAGAHNFSVDVSYYRLAF
jgi:hypothetical protein